MTILAIGLLIPLLGTMLGSAFVFMMKGEMSVRLQKALLGFASGVMVAASVWSLLIPAMEMDASGSAWAVLPAAVGFLLGMGFLLMIDELTPHLHIGTDKLVRIVGVIDIAMGQIHMHTYFLQIDAAQLACC